MYCCYFALYACVFRLYLGPVTFAVFLAGLLEINAEPFVLLLFALGKADKMVQVEALAFTVKRAVLSIFIFYTDPLHAYIIGRTSASFTLLIGSCSALLLAKQETSGLENENDDDTQDISWELQKECHCDIFLADFENFLALHILHQSQLRVHMAAIQVISIVSRIFLKPIEQACELSWSQDKASSVDKKRECLAHLLRLYVPFCSCCAAVLIVHAKHFLYLLGCDVRDSSILKMQLSLFRVPLMGINGVLESFLRANAPLAIIKHRQRFIEKFLCVQLPVMYLLGRRGGLAFVLYSSLLQTLPRIGYALTQIPSTSNTWGMRKEVHTLLVAITLFSSYSCLRGYLIATYCGLCTRVITALSFFAIVFTVQASLEPNLVHEGISLASQTLKRVASTLSVPKHM